MAVNENRGIETACRAEESHVEQVYLESVSILVGGEGQSRLRDAVDAQKQSCVHEPLDGLFVAACAAPVRTAE